MKIGIDIGGSHIAIGIVGKDGDLIDKEIKDISSTEIESEEEAEQIILDTIDDGISKLIKRCGFTKEDITIIGLAVPGNPTETAIRNVVNLQIKNFDIATILQKKYDAKIKIKNDGKCAGIAEKKFGTLKKYDDCVFLCIGTGVGSAVFMDGELLEPKRNIGFEFGHMIIDKNGNECNCGNKGCFETYASMKRFKKKAIKTLNLKEDIVSEELQKYIRENVQDKDVKKLINEYIDDLTIGVSNIINIFEPEAICFGGSFAYYGDIFIPLLQENLKKYVFNKDNTIDIFCAKLKNDAGIIGAV